MAEQKQATPYSNNLFSNHFLEERIESLDEWKNADIEDKYEELQELWNKKKRYFENSSRNEDNTQDEWIDEVLKIIGHIQRAKEPTHTIGNDKNLNPDYLFFKNFEEKLDHEGTDKQFEEGYLIGEAKKWGRTLDKSKDNHENPAFQIFNYVDRLRTPWGLLTNGKKWRLYSYEDCEADTFYEIDIVKNILKEDDRETALQNFKYFYLFFRQESFLPKGDAFLDQVYEGSESYAKDLEEDLEDDIYTALEETARGFFETNDIEKTKENIDEVHRSSLILLYRMLFILNAESRGLLPVDNDKYENYSLEYLKNQFVGESENVFTDDTWLWEDRITTLFDIIDDGRDYENFKVTGYNGGLFDDEKHEFLANHQLKGTHIERIIELLAISEDEETDEIALVDYRDLNIRHLGSVYEGLLEHELQQAEEDLVLENGEWESASDSNKDFEGLPRDKKVRKGEVYLTNESGERKATGSYYTPEYIVEYIVENTVGPKVEEKIEKSSDEELLDNVLELNVCDPAMGSGHFLTEATSFIARRVIEHGQIPDEKVEGENEFVWVKRQVVSHCIYGVDINPLAVELGKLGLWIETMAEGKPLSFLDHHLKVGNSLIGSDFDEIFSHPNEKQKRVDSERWQYVGSPEDLKQQFQEDYREIENRDEDTKEKVHEKENDYKEFINSTIYKQVQQLANVHTRQYFNEEANSSDYEDLVLSIGKEDTHIEATDWFKSAQQDASTKNYFHWELEFPKVFFGENEGFDAIVGNPPYGYRGIPSDEEKKYLENNFETHEYNYENYLYFTELGVNLLNEDALQGYIIPNTFLSADKMEVFRKFLLEDNSLSEIYYLGEGVFSGVTLESVIEIIDKSKESNKVSINISNDSRTENPTHSYQGDLDIFRENENSVFDIELTPDRRDIVSRMETKSTSLEDIAYVTVGINTGYIRDEMTSDEKEDDRYHKMLNGKNIGRYSVDWDGKWIIYDKEFVESFGDKGRTLPPERIFTESKILLQRTRRGLERKLVAYLDENQFYNLNRVSNVVLEDDNYSLHSLLAILNSKLLDRYFNWVFNEYEVKPSHLNKLPIIDQKPSSTEFDLENGSISDLEDLGSPEKVKLIGDLAENIQDLIDEREKFNLNLKDYLGNYSDGKTLGDIYTPVNDISSKILADTAADRESLRIGRVEFEKRNTHLFLMASVRYKPDKSEGVSENELDRWGYTETELIPAMKFDVDENLESLIQEFVKLAVDEGNGFASFRESATKTNSIIDRLKKLTLPNVSDVADDLKKFIEQKEKAEELEEKIEKTDQQINEIVYDLYDLTEEEIEIVEESVN